MGGLPQAKEFSEDVLSTVPHLMLAYNNSPSFNWDKSGMTDEQMKTFIWDLAKMGFCWQNVDGNHGCGCDREPIFETLILARLPAQQFLCKLVRHQCRLSFDADGTGHHHPLGRHWPA